MIDVNKCTYEHTNTHVCVWGNYTHSNLMQIVSYIVSSNSKYEN